MLYTDKRSCGESNDRVLARKSEEEGGGGCPVCGEGCDPWMRVGTLGVCTPQQGLCV